MGTDVNQTIKFVVFPKVGGLRAILGMQSGQLLQVSCLGAQCFPSEYHFFAASANTRSAAFSTGRMISLELWPFQHANIATLFAVAWSTGIVGLFSASEPSPLHRWDVRAEIVKLLWSSERPAVFFVITRSGRVFGYDLLQSTSSASLEFRVQTTGDVVDAAISNESILALGSGNGSVSIHTVNEQLRMPLVDEQEEVAELLNLTPKLKKIGVDTNV
ncbi:hypothetical protein M427DRAFT_53015 [Gonapodya prolifera JEL478]|uniref:Uncharacterized protein n=1 Tax=Gonapodya prolifera (strain JEL478) TaxID=1344416 RepID=A0A139ASS4_GONPJ|nr:hypothetical protein M427DRAFT_53015 [Gonapodya prolifera JEL478]|eukprot:KXS19603.1 hypothetical protein M427DRAFT_53015 [Gonapodya prolifera JEL478]